MHSVNTSEVSAPATWKPRAKHGEAKLLIAYFPGNRSIDPATVEWYVDTVAEAKKDPRIGKVGRVWYADTPITMTRNRVIAQAISGGFDYVLMFDADMVPDMDVGKVPGAKPFFKTAFDFLWDNPAPAAIAAPYVGPPPINNIYVFRWRSFCNHEEANYRLEQYTREEAYERGGIEKVAALPTGVILYDMRAFERTPPLEGLGWYYYEWTSKYAHNKASTEDVTQTRDMSLAWWDVPEAGVYCAWDCWAGHYKSGVFGKPTFLTPNEIGERFTGVRKRALTREFQTVILCPNEEAAQPCLTAQPAQKPGKSQTIPLPKKNAAKHRKPGPTGSGGSAKSSAGRKGNSRKRSA